jgi:uncharacterized membrane protein
MNESSAASSREITAAEATPNRTDPFVRVITVNDVNQAWERGVRDFQAAPSFGLAFGAFYAFAGIAIVSSTTALGLSYLAYPLSAGFALIGPFAAVGLYEVSRSLEAGAEVSWRRVLRIVVEQRNRQLAWMALVVLFVFIIWMYQVQLLLTLFVGFRSFATLEEFLVVLTTTPEGVAFLLLGNAVGVLLSLMLFCLTVVSFPLLLDHDFDFVTAMITSVRAVVVNPAPMLGWGFTVGVLLVLASLPFFLGLIVVLPIVGHATWHLYRAVVDPVPT